MPVYRFQAPDGRQFGLEGDSPPNEQELEAAFAALPPLARAPMATSGRTPEQEALAQQFISQAQRPTLEKLVEGGLGLGKALVSPLISMAKGVGQIPTVINDPSTLIPTGGEVGRRVGMDITNLVRNFPQVAPYTTALGPLLGPPMDIVRGVGNLASRTPSEQEVEAFVQGQPLEQALAEERAAVRFPGANPELAEGITQAVETFSGAGALRGAISGVNIAKQSIPRIFRGALKPKPQFGVRLEKAVENTLDDIYHANPNADKVGQMPIEGYQQTVSQVQRNVGQEIDSALTQQNIPLTAGDEIADALNAEANKLEKAGQPAQNVLILRERANDFSGKLTDIDSTRTATTLANRELTPAYTRTREMANPLRAQADTIANKIIAEKGGGILNKAIESIKGPAGLNLRKKWSDLTLLEKHASDRLNKIINDAPPDLQSTVVSTLSSLEGLGGLFALTQGYVSGAGVLAIKGAKEWAKRTQRELKDSNSLITTAYEKLRASPPPPRTAPVAPVPAIIPPPQGPITADLLTPRLPISGPIIGPSGIPTLRAAEPPINLTQLIQAGNAANAANTARVLSAAEVDRLRRLIENAPPIQYY